MIDSHVHFWNYHPVKDAWISEDMKMIARDFYPSDLSADFFAHGVEGCVAVQASQSEKETEFLIHLAKESSLIKGVVGWVDLKSGQLEERLGYYQQYNILKGWRHIVQAEQDGFLMDQNFINGIKMLDKYNYTYDILITYNQYPDAIRFVDHFDGQLFVIDHCGKPDIKNQEKKLFTSYVNEIAKHENVYCKLSGLLTEAHWKNWAESDIFNYLDVVFKAFGTDRLMFGSDWPVVNVAGNYATWINLIKKYLQQFSKEEQHKVMGENAINFYKLER